MTTHSVDRRTPVMTPTLRRSILGMLTGLWAYVSVALNPLGTPLRGDTLLANSGPYMWFGAYLALPCLFAIWVALAKQPLTVRLPRAVAFAALLGLMGTWGHVRNTPERKPDIDFPLILLSVSALQAMPLALLRWWYGWHLRVEGDDDSQGRVQFGISQLLVWTATTAVLLGLAGWIVSDWRAVGESLRQARWLGAAIGVLIVSVLSLPLLIPSVGFMLGVGRRKSFGIWLLAVAIFVSVAPLATSLLAFSMGVISGVPVTDVAIASLAVLPLLAGFLFGLLGSLLVIRLCGFRLVRRIDASPATPA